MKKYLLIFLLLFFNIPLCFAGYSRYTDTIIIHHSADEQDSTAKEIDIIHKKRGFKEIAYHYLIRRNGTIEIGRSLNKIGAHARHRNRASIGICLNGVNNFTLEQKLALTELVKELVEKYQIISIERHHNKCPGDGLDTEDLEAYILKEDVEDEGIGSWYLDTQTSSGEKYNRNSLTCASNKYAFNTILRVSNQENQKSVLVRVNDRGPFVKGRIIDLTPKAFSRIANLKDGLCRVKIERIK